MKLEDVAKYRYYPVVNRNLMDGRWAQIREDRRKSGRSGVGRRAPQEGVVGSKGIRSEVHYARHGGEYKIKMSCKRKGEERWYNQHPVQ